MKVILVISVILNLILLIPNDKPCQSCELKDKQYKDMIRKFNDRLKADSSHQWCIKLQ